MAFETILLGTMAAGTAVSAFGQARAGAQAARAAGVEAAEIERRGTEEARLFSREGRRAIGSQVAGYTRGGVRAGEGSPLLLALESADELERGLSEIRRGASAEAELTRFRGREARTAGLIGGGGTILGGTAGFLKTGRELERTSRTGYKFGF